MAVKIVESKPDPSVVKRCICKKCGVTLEYVPIDVRVHKETDYTGSTDRYDVIDCPNCSYMVFVK